MPILFSCAEFIILPMYRPENYLQGTVWYAQLSEAKAAHLQGYIN